MHVQHLHITRTVAKQQRHQAPLVLILCHIHLDFKRETANGGISRQLADERRNHPGHINQLAGTVKRRVVVGAINVVQTCSQLDDPFRQISVNARQKLEHSN